MFAWLCAYGAFLIVLANPDNTQAVMKEPSAYCWEWNPYTDKSKWSECNE